MQSKNTTIQYQRFQQAVPDEVVRRAQNGDMAAHSELYKMFSQAIYTLANGICRDPHCAEDLLQSIFLKLFDKVGSFGFRAPFGMWLRQIAVNECLMYLRKHKKYSETLSTDEYEFTNYQETQSLSNRKSNMAELFGDQHDLAKLLSNLPLDVRTVLWLKEVEGYTHDEIALMVNKSPSYSKSITHRAFKALAKKVALSTNAATSTVEVG
ncbi:RNA polymerase sigma factor SigM [Arenicella sp. 4NH20-0111]|uniref:RNA polymerase sigma factor n=1 Tax=Arenicella sp. 4NH20-0111 TaxID=3127648 RepID=UPI00310A6C5E